MIATHPAQCNKSLSFYRQKNISALKLSGEPFIFDAKSKHHGEIMVLLLGPGRYWRCKITGVIGHGMDSRCRDELSAILQHRRHGEIWGRWYSPECPSGEIGCNHYSRVVEISEDEYLKSRDEMKHISV